MTKILIHCPTEIAILMATYNGEKYIVEQLESILNQTYTNWTLYIRDDGSADKTTDIISQYAQKYSKIVLIKSDISHLGACNNFLTLLDSIDSSYYMFSDQDDIWDPNKIELSYLRIKQIESHNKSIPVIVHTDLRVTNERAVVIYESFWKIMKIKPSILQKKQFFPVCNPCTGCTMIMNSHIKKYIYPIPKNLPMHDLWIAFKASLYGQIDNLPFPTILYRQHSNNSVGARKINWKYFTSRIGNFRETIKEQYRMACFFSKHNYGSILKYFFYKTVYSIIRFI